MGSLEFVYDPTDPYNEFDYWFINYRYRILKNFMAGDRALELGCATGISTFLLRRLGFSEIVVIEKHRIYIEKAKEYLSKKFSSLDSIMFVEADWLDVKFEEYGPFTDIVWFGGAEYITFANTQHLLRQFRKVLESTGRVHMVVSNKFSFHRRLGFYMGIINGFDSFSERDVITGGKKWLGDIYTLIDLMREANYQVIHIEPYFLKILPNDKLIELARQNPKLIEALFEIGGELPNYCAEIYICAMPK